MVIDTELIPLLDEMLMELTTERLEVCLIPGNNLEKVNDGSLIRVAISKNPEWYRRLCASYQSTRTRKRKESKSNTKIKRAYILKLLGWMIKNAQSKSIYAPFLVDVAVDRKELYDELEKQEFIPWNNQF